jgi:hypothetical protein
MSDTTTSLAVDVLAVHYDPATRGLITEYVRENDLRVTGLATGE